MNIEMILLLVLFTPAVIGLGYRFWRQHRADNNGVCFKCGVKLTEENTAFLAEPGAILPVKTKMCRACKERLGLRQLVSFIVFLLGGVAIIIVSIAVFELVSA